MLSFLHANFGPAQAPETLAVFLDGRIPPSTRSSDTDQEPPKKKRKGTSSSAAKAPLTSAASDDYLTLARVDLSIVGESRNSTELLRLTVGLDIPEKPERVVPFSFLRW